MDFENIARVEKKNVKPRYLLRICQQFADIAGNGQWFDSENREVSVMRSFVETIGRDVQLGNGTFIKESRVRTEVGFQGEKEVAYELDDGTVALEEGYIVNVKVKERINYDELTEDVIEKARAVLEVYGYDEDDEADENDDEDDDEVVLASVDFSREYEVAYAINEDGEIVDHYVAIRYFGEDTEVEKAIYKQSDTLEVATSVVDSAAVEWVRNDGAPAVREEDIDTFMSSFEDIIQTILEYDQFEKIEQQLVDPERDKHYRRAVGIIAMAALGFERFKL